MPGCICCCILAGMCWPGCILGVAVQLCWFPSFLWEQWTFSSFGGPGCGADMEGSRAVGALLALLRRHCWCLWVYISVPELHFSICSCQWQLLNFPDASSKWVERWQKSLLWFKWVRGQCHTVCLIIYLPSYTQHLLSLEWFKHIITFCFSSFIMLVCCYSVVRDLSGPVQSRGRHLILLHFDVPPPCFF